MLQSLALNFRASHNTFILPSTLCAHHGSIGCRLCSTWFFIQRPVWQRNIASPHTEYKVPWRVFHWPLNHSSQKWYVSFLLTTHWLELIIMPHTKHREGYKESRNTHWWATIMTTVTILENFRIWYKKKGDFKSTDFDLVIILLRT